MARTSKTTLNRSGECRYSCLILKRKSFQLFTIEYAISCGFVTNGFYYVEMCSLCNSFKKFIPNWKIIALQYCIGFYQYQHESAIGLPMSPSTWTSLPHPSPSHSVTALMRVLSWMDVVFCQMFLCIIRDDHRIFILLFVNVVYHIDCGYWTILASLG